MKCAESKKMVAEEKITFESKYKIVVCRGRIRISFMKGFPLEDKVIKLRARDY